MISNTIASPLHNNNWFAWRSLDDAKNLLNIHEFKQNNEQCIFSNKVNCIVFNNGRRLAEVNGTTVWLNVAPERLKNGKDWRIAAIDLDLISLTMQAETAEKPEKLTVMIDAGHGGNDSGAVSRCGTLKEKDLTLDLALKTGKLLKKSGFKVLYTRTKDKALTLNERSSAASGQKADLFISIHANNASNTNACGIETFVLTPSGYPGTSANSPPRGWQIGNKNDFNSNLLGYTIQKSLLRDSYTIDRGLKRQSFFVLRETYCPAILVEVGFLSNSEDLSRLKNRKWRDSCAEKLSHGILEYCGKVVSLENAVAAKRKRETEANERWSAFLAAKMNRQTEADLLSSPADKNSTGKKASTKTQIAKIPEQKIKSNATAQAELRPPSQSSMNAKQVQKVIQAISDVDLNKLTKSAVQSVATNIYMTEEDDHQITQKDSESDLKALMDFYEKGSLN